MHEMHEEHHGHKAMNAAHHEKAEHGKAPKKPSMAERRKAMNPNFMKKGGHMAHKDMGGAMPMPAPQAPMGGGMPAMPAPMSRPKVMAMSPQQSMARRAMLKKAITGMKKGGGMEAHIEKLEKELHHHENMPMGKAHKMHHKADGGAIDNVMTKTTIKGNAKKFEHTKMNDGQHHDKAHGTGAIKESNAGGYKHGGHAHKMHHKSTGGDIPADTHENKNVGKSKMHGTIEGNEHDYLSTEMHSAKSDKAHGTGKVNMANAGGFKRGGKMHHKAAGGHMAPGLSSATVEGGHWENRPADTTPAGKKNTKTGEVHESNAGGYKHGGHSSKKAYATGGNVVSDGKAVKMPKHFVSRPVANTMQSGTFAKGGKVDFYSDLAKKLQKNPEKPNLRLIKTHTGPKGHVAKVYKDRDYGEYRTKFYSPEGKHLTEGDSHTDDSEDAHMTAMHEVNKGYAKGGKTKKC
jgi:hypothetical protein